MERRLRSPMMAKNAEKAQLGDPPPAPESSRIVHRPAGA